MARNFNGGSDSLQFANPPAPSAGTVCFWLKTTQTTTNVSLFALHYSGTYSGFIILLNNTANKISLYGRAGGDWEVALTSSASVNTGDWKHLAIVYDTAGGGSNKIYIDGVEDAAVNSAFSWNVDNRYGIYLGDSPDGFWATLVGDLAEVALFNRKLTADEIGALAKSFSPRMLRPVTYIPLVRDVRDSYGLISTIVGTTAADHPRTLGGSV